MAGLTEEQVEATDLQGGYPELQPHLAGLRAEVDLANGVVSVPFDQHLAPRLAVRREQGCTQMPIGATSVAFEPPVGAIWQGPSPLHSTALFVADKRAWPLGDGDAVPEPSSQPRLEAAITAALADQYGKNVRTSAILVVKDGQIVAERYGLGIGMHIPQRTWSVAKSLTSALVGRATALRLLDVSSAATVPVRWAIDRRSTITIDTLLRMQSGLWTSGPGSRTDALYFGGATVLETAGTAPLEAEPGTRFRYANNDTLLAAAAMRKAVADRVPHGATADRMLRAVIAADRYQLDELLLPLGMTRTTIETDWQGDAILSSQVWMTARDMARLALLHLNDGQVPDGKGGMVRLLPEGWVRDATTPVGPQPDGDMGYGRAIWLMGPKQGLPEGTYAFLGNRGQIAIIVPSEQLVVVRRGFDPHGVRFDGPALVRDIIAALRGSRAE